MWTIVVILAIMWLLGMLTSYTVGGLLHILLIVAVVMVILNLVRGRRSI
ncbi:MAG: lmo0937 family membrane protein [Fimbriimonadaceae bacterium]